MKAKQVIVMRKDLNMRKGKMVAQGAHASMKVILDRMTNSPNFKYLQGEEQWEMDGILNKSLKIEAGTALHDWIEGLFTKICVTVDSEQELEEIYQKAIEQNVPCAMIVDAGLTEFGGVPTKTCCAIGPAWSEEVDRITGHLKLL